MLDVSKRFSKAYLEVNSGQLGTNATIPLKIVMSILITSSARCALSIVLKSLFKEAKETSTLS